MRNRMYGGVRGRKTRVGENYIVFLLLDLSRDYLTILCFSIRNRFANGREIAR